MRHFDQRPGLTFFERYGRWRKLFGKRTHFYVRSETRHRDGLEHGSQLSPSLELISLGSGGFGDDIWDYGIDHLLRIRVRFLIRVERIVMPGFNKRGMRSDSFLRPMNPRERQRR
ncbi:MAG: hypothetical protein QMC36_05335 [Patescibacteria group bacterium]